MSPDKEFLCHFNVDGRTFAFTIWADDWPDAERRLERLRQSAKVVGSDLIRVPAVLPGRWFPDFIVSLLKWMRP